MLVEPGHPILLVYPAMIPPSGSTAGDESLGRLLGTTRALVLRRLATDGGLTTTVLSRAVGISLSSASEHASALRTAGLVVSEREGGAVRHHLTALGRACCGASSDPGEAWTTPDQVAGWSSVLP
ncbi:winged helix-turn-helix domain-containing protein [Micromonospora sp. M12]